MSKYGVIFCGPNTGKCGPEITLYIDTFHAVIEDKINITLVINESVDHNND